MERRGQLLFGCVFTLAFLLYAEACQRNIINAQGIPLSERQRILDMHNSIRQATAMGQLPGQPPAANMLEMKWDEELALRAQKWATSCYSEDHDPHRRTKRFAVGQNIATFWTTKQPTSAYDMAPEFARAMNGWFKEVNKYHFGRISGYGGTGHYTQMIWATTNLVGCGYSFYYDPSKGYTKNYICNYGPSGNVLTKMPYERGYPSCPNYGLDHSRKYNGLCDKPSVKTSDFYNYIG